MLGKKQEINLQLSQIIDGILVAVAFWLCHSTRFYLLPLIFPDLPPIPGLDGFIWMMAIAIPFTPIFLEFEGFYQHPMRKKVFDSIGQFIRVGVWLMLALGSCVIFFRWQANSRLVMLMLPFAVSGLLLLREAMMKRYLRWGVTGGDKGKERVVVAGLDKDIEGFLSEMTEDDAELMQVVARYDLECHSVDEFIEMLHQHSINRVIFVAIHTQFGKVQEAIHACEREGVEAWLSTNFFQTSIARPTFDVMGGRLMLVFSATPPVSWAILVKEILDRVVAFLAIVGTSPFWLLVALGIKLSSQGKIFYLQERCGQNGLPFKMLKFRTMFSDAETQQLELEEKNQMEGPVFKLKKDPRVFKLGSILRKLSIDELPQLVNVLRGEMSLVGPRPLPVEQIKQIEDKAQRRRLSVKPGITCLWQVSGRNQISRFEDWVALDLEYIDNWSLWLDFKILLRTIPVVVSGKGAS